MLGHQPIQAFANNKDFPRLDVNICRLPLSTA